MSALFNMFSEYVYPMIKNGTAATVNVVKWIGWGPKNAAAWGTSPKMLQVYAKPINCYSFLTAVSCWSSLGVYRYILAALRYWRKAAMRTYIFYRFVILKSEMLDKNSMFFSGTIFCDMVRSAERSMSSTNAL